MTVKLRLRVLVVRAMRQRLIQKARVDARVVIAPGAIRHTPISVTVGTPPAGNSRTSLTEDMRHSFKFMDDRLQRRLLTLLNRESVPCRVDNRGVVHYSSTIERLVQNELISAIRSQAFPKWQILTCPKDWLSRYRKYMVARRIPFQEELSDGQVWFLLPQKYRPHSWKRL